MKNRASVDLQVMNELAGRLEDLPPAPEPTPANDPAGFTPPRVTTPEQRLEAKKAAPADPSFGEVVGAAVERNWLGSAFLKAMNAESFEPDPEFRIGALPKEEQDALYAGVPEELRNRLSEATSMAHAKNIREQLLNATKLQDTLHRAGYGGIAADTIMSILDPAAIAATVASEGIAALAVWGAKISRIGRVLRAAGVGAATNAGIEAVLAAEDPTRTGKDVALAAAIGLVFGGAVGAIGRTAEEVEFRKLARQTLDDALARKEGVGLDGAPREVAPPKASLVDPEGNVVKVDAPQIAPTPQPTGSVGAAIMPTKENYASLPAIEAFEKAAEEVPQGAFAGKLRFDMIGQLLESKHPLVRKLAISLSPDPVGLLANGKGHGVAAVEIMTREFNKAQTSFYKVAERAFDEWAEAKGLSFLQKHAPETRDGFFEEVGRALRREPGAYTPDPHINRVADNMRQLQADLLAKAQKAGVKGFEDIAENASYMTRIHSLRKLDAMRERFGDHQLRQLIAKGLLNKSDELDAQDAYRIAGAYLKRVYSYKNGIDIGRTTMFSHNQRDALAGILREELVDELSPTELDGLIARVQADIPKKEEGVISRAKRRLGLDETVEMPLIEKIDPKDPTKGTRETTVRLDDLFESNAEAVFSTYSRQMTGAIAMAEMGFKSTNDFASMINKIRETAHMAGVSKPDLDDEVAKLEVLYKGVMGHPLGEHTKMSEWGRLLRNFNYARLMNQVGIAQLSEFGMIMGHAGLSAMLRYMPVMGSIFKRARSGELEDAFLREIENVWSFGTDRIREAGAARFDDHAFLGDRVTKLDRYMKIATGITSDLSLMHPIQTTLERLGAMATIQRFADMATKGKGINPRRLAAMGLDESMVERINALIRANVKFTEGGLTGRRIKTLNLDAWDRQDPEAAAAFVNAIHRTMRRTIQKNDIGDLSKWMTSDMGKIILQFRSFVAVGWAKNTLHSFAMRDMAAAQTFLFSTMIGGLAYVGQTYLNAAGRSDREKFLEERLSDKAIALGAFNRAGFSSLIPMGVDTLGMVTGMGQPFQFGRNTGLSNTLFGNPSADFANKAINAVKGVVAPIVNPDYQFSQQDARNILQAGIFSNMAGIRNMLEVMIQDLPEKPH